MALTIAEVRSNRSLGPLEIGIFDESQPLKTACTWGPVGAEAVMAQCYPEEISLFFGSFDALNAREEGLSYADTLESEGVTVILARDILADSLRPKRLDKEAVISAMTQKARLVQSEYGTKVSDYGDLIRTLVEKDIERYGEEKGLSLNQALSVAPSLPLGNSLFGRDQMNVLLDTRVVSKMAKDIRKREVSLYELVYGKVLAPHKRVLIPNPQTFEGGDAFIHNGVVFVGVGTRTTNLAALSLYQSLKDGLESYGLKFALVQDEEASSRSFREQQDSMHLDTFSNPIGSKDIAVCVEEARKRKITFIDTNNGSTVVSNGKATFMDYLERTEGNIVTICPEEQKGFGCNFLLLGENSEGKATIIVPLRSNTDINNKLESAGKRVIYADLSESTKGYGAAHCMTGQLRRSIS